MSLTSQSAMVERLAIKNAGQQVVARIAASKTVDYTTPRGTITRVDDEQFLYAIVSAETSVGGKRVREFRCMLEDLPTAPITEIKIVFEGGIYSVVKHDSGRYSTVLSTTRA